MDKGTHYGQAIQEAYTTMHTFAYLRVSTADETTARRPSPDAYELDRIVASEFQNTDNIQGTKKRDAWMEAALAYEMTSFEFSNIDVADYGGRR